MSNASSFSPGDIAIAKFARYPSQVTIEERLEDGSWRVRTHTGSTRVVHRLESLDGLHVETSSYAASATAEEPASVAAVAEHDSASAIANPAQAAYVPAPAASPAIANPVPSPRAVPPKGIGLLSAAAAVLERSEAPMSVKAMIEGAKSQGLWSPKGGKTPEQTLYSAIIREIKDKGASSRFRKEGRGIFTFAR